MAIIDKKIIKVSELLTNKELVIPDYQRPYKWTVKNVYQLMSDISRFSDKLQYRLGTIVIHSEEVEENGIKGINLNIVDGQQRTVTLILILKALMDIVNKIQNPQLKTQIINLNSDVINPEFKEEISLFNLFVNYKEIERRIIDFDEKKIDFLFNGCEFVVFVLSDVSEAFQFFDSQNARGKDLDPHDLLKAFHLREFSVNDEKYKLPLIDSWETIQTKELVELFGEYLFRVRNWSKGLSARYFSKNEVDVFKGVNTETIDDYPYTKIIRIAHYYIDRYNNSYERLIEKDSSNYPFQLDQPIINGRRFFEMINYYQALLKSVKESKQYNGLSDIAVKILRTIDDDGYEGKDRTGDKYTRMIFDNALLYYIDKFGLSDISKAIEKIFIWAYYVRLDHQLLQLATIDNYVLSQKNIFRVIKEAIKPEECLNIELNILPENKSTKTKLIEEIFKELKYYAETV